MRDAARYGTFSNCRTNSLEAKVPAGQNYIHRLAGGENYRQHPLLLPKAHKIQDHVQDYVLLGACHNHRGLVHARGGAPRTRSCILTHSIICVVSYEFLFALEARYNTFCHQSHPVFRQSGHHSWWIEWATSSDCSHDSDVARTDTVHDTLGFGQNWHGRCGKLSTSRWQWLTSQQSKRTCYGHRGEIEANNLL